MDDCEGKNMKNRMIEKGFSLIEVMIALLILAVGILGISKLQGTMIKSASDANQRTVAVSLAQQKIDDLKSFVLLTADVDSSSAGDEAWTSAATWPATQQSFAFINDSEGGIIGPADTGSPIAIGNYAYTLDWEVVDYYYPTDLAAAAIVTGTIVPEFKQVEVTVGWTDNSGQPQTVVLDTVIDAYAPALTALADNSSTGGVPPYVYATPGFAPEVIPICISGDCDGTDPGGLKKETDNPEPAVSQNDQFSNISFTEITYFHNTNIIKKQEDFETVNCVCEQVTGSASVTAYEPAYIELTEDADGNNVIKNVVGDTVEDADRRLGERKSTGQNGQQDDLCDVCCRDHHDFTGAANKYDPFRTQDVEHYPADLNGDHGHFNPDNSGDLVAANSVGDEYLESCKFVRIDGILRVAQDWKQEIIKVMPENDLILDISDWQNYTNSFIDEYVTAITGSYPQVTPDVSLFSTSLSGERGPDSSNGYPMNSNSSEQLIARSIFIDYMPDSLISELQTNGINLEIIPFHDVNTTKLALWEMDSENAAVASITNEALADNNAHSRGNLTANSSGTTFVSANMRNSNTGLTNSTNTDPDDVTTKKDDMYVTVTGGSTPPSVTHLTGTITMSNASELDYDEIVMTAGTGVSCARIADEGNGGNTRYAFDCRFTTGELGTVVFSGYNPCQIIGNGNNAVLTFLNNIISPATDIVVANDNTGSETTTVTKTITADTILNITINNTASTTGSCL